MKRMKYCKMADFWYLHRLKSNAFNGLHENAVQKPLTKYRIACDFHESKLRNKGLKSLQLYLHSKIEKYRLQIFLQKQEMADIKYNESMLKVKSEIFQYWKRYACKKAKKRQKKLRIRLKEYFYIWKFNTQLLQ